MRKIVGLIQPFDYYQNFYVYEDGNKLEAATPKLEKVNETIFHFADKYEITKIDLIGPKQYIRGFIKKIKEAELNKYNMNKLEINIAVRNNNE